ncbi:MAG UNVERIFIED_CONTAM: hypothetical protein LVR29_07550 [Microcystis novacekii LVE1205-3]
MYYDAVLVEEVEASDEYRCEPSSAGCPLRFCLYGFFMFSGSIEEYRITASTACAHSARRRTIAGWCGAKSGLRALPA